MVFPATRSSGTLGAVACWYPPEALILILERELCFGLGRGQVSGGLPSLWEQGVHVTELNKGQMCDVITKQRPPPPLP